MKVPPCFRTNPNMNPDVCFHQRQMLALGVPLYLSSRKCDYNPNTTYCSPPPANVSKEQTLSCAPELFFLRRTSLILFLVHLDSVAFIYAEVSLQLSEEQMNILQRLGRLYSFRGTIGRTVLTLHLGMFNPKHHVTPIWTIYPQESLGCLCATFTVYTRALVFLKISYNISPKLRGNVEITGNCCMARSKERLQSRSRTL